MVEIANDFVKYKVDKHGNDWVLLIFDNLDAHCYGEDLNIFGEANILDTAN